MRYYPREFKRCCLDERLCAFTMPSLSTARHRTFVCIRVEREYKPGIKSYPPVDSDGGKASEPLPQVTFMSSVRSSSIVEPFTKASHSRKQFDFQGTPSIFTPYPKLALDEWLREGRENVI